MSFFFQVLCIFWYQVCENQTIGREVTWCFVLARQHKICPKSVFCMLVYKTHGNYWFLSSPPRWRGDMAPLHKICVWTQIGKIKRKLSFNQSELRIKDLRSNANFMQQGPSKLRPSVCPPSVRDAYKNLNNFPTLHLFVTKLGW